jgi:hypothetical protein
MKIRFGSRNGYSHFYGNTDKFSNKLIGGDQCRSALVKAGQDEVKGRADAAPAGRLQAVYALSVVLWFRVSPASPVFKENVRSAVLF